MLVVCVYDSVELILFSLVCSSVCLFLCDVVGLRLVGLRVVGLRCVAVSRVCCVYVCVCLWCSVLLVL